MTGKVGLSESSSAAPGRSVGEGTCGAASLFNPHMRYPAPSSSSTSARSYGSISSSKAPALLVSDFECRSDCSSFLDGVAPHLLGHYRFHCVDDPVELDPHLSDVDGAYTSSNTCGVPPARSPLSSSMLSAPHSIAAMIEVSLPAGFTAPDATRVDGRSTCLPINSESPVCSANSSPAPSPRPAPDSAHRTPPTQR